MVYIHSVDHKDKGVGNTVVLVDSQNDLTREKLDPSNQYQNSCANS